MKLIGSTSTDSFIPDENLYLEIIEAKEFCNFRVFEPIVGFSAEAHAQSLSWFIFNDLGGETRLLSSAATSSVLTIIGVSILLFPVLIRTWRDFNEKSAK